MPKPFIFQSLIITNTKNYSNFKVRQLSLINQLKMIVRLFTEVVNKNSV